jgi:DNA-binding beta-propeller fold protein YncE
VAFIDATTYKPIALPTVGKHDGYVAVAPDGAHLYVTDMDLPVLHELDAETRDLYDGFAAGINRYVELHPEEFPPGMPTDFSGYDVATPDIGDGPPAAKIRRFVAALKTVDGQEQELKAEQQVAPIVAELEPSSRVTRFIPASFVGGDQ